MKKKKIASHVQRMIDDLEDGKVTYWWDAGHKPREDERLGRIGLLRHILSLFEAKAQED